MNYIQSLKNTTPQTQLAMIISKAVGDLNNLFLTDRKLPKEMSHLSRGVNLNPNDFIKYCCKTDKDGNLYYFDNGFVSFSAEKNQGLKFAKSGFLLNMPQHIIEDKNNYLNR
jgi:hypothetical protein